MTTVPALRDDDTIRKALEQWLTDHLRGAAGVAVSDLNRPQTAGGSNETLLAQADWTQDGRRAVPSWCSASHRRRCRCSWTRNSSASTAPSRRWAGIQTYRYRRYGASSPTNRCWVLPSGSWIAPTGSHPRTSRRTTKPASSSKPLRHSESSCGSTPSKRWGRSPGAAGAVRLPARARVGGHPAAEPGRVLEGLAGLGVRGQAQRHTGGAAPVAARPLAGRGGAGAVVGRRPDGQHAVPGLAMRCRPGLGDGVARGPTGGRRLVAAARRSAEQRHRTRALARTGRPRRDDCGMGAEQRAARAGPRMVRSLRWVPARRDTAARCEHS